MSTTRLVAPPARAPISAPASAPPSPSLPAPGPPLVPTLVDLRVDGRRQQLSYPRDTMLLVAGVPGAGKSALLRRMFPQPTPDRLHVLDSEQPRREWSRWLGTLPYRWWRPLVHLTHYLRILRALTTGDPVVVHDCGTRPWLRRLLTRRARRHGASVHVLLIDVPPEVARAGQRRRGRMVRRESFSRHCRRWRRLVDDVRHDPAAALPGVTSVVLLDRTTADLLQRITIGPAG